MNPLALPVWAKVAGVVAILLMSFSAGWIINGWRWNSNILEAQAKLTQARIDAEKQSRAKELSIQAAADAARSTKDAEIIIIRDQLDAALVELRRRPLRSANLSGTTGSGTPGTGRELSREDAEFLAREAARANEMKMAMQYCYATYRAVQASMGSR